jgi:carboxymethylenebutenolidase
MKNQLTPEQNQILGILNEHVDAEVRGDLDLTLATMSSNPHVNHVPTLIGGIGLEAVKSFYKNLVPAKSFFPSDVEFIEVSQTIDQNQVVLELLFKCTHSSEIAWMLPGIKPTGKRIEIPLVVIAGIKDNKVTHEHIYWDQASVLVQIGLLDPQGLPVKGIETAQHMETIMKKMENVSS